MADQALPSGPGRCGNRFPDNGDPACGADDGLRLTGGYRATPGHRPLSREASIQPLLFQTDRLDARRWTAADLPSIHAIYADPIAMRFVGDGSPLDQDRCRAWLEVTDRNYERRGYGMFALEERETGEVVGCGGLVHPDDQPEAEMKYAFRRTHWRRGLASEAVPAILHHAHRDLGLKRIIATVAKEHGISRRVLRSAGLLPIGERSDERGIIAVHAIDFDANQ